MTSSQSKALSASQRNGSAAGRTTAGRRPDGGNDGTQPKQTDILPEPVREWVREQPWALVGAAAGLGVAAGAVSRHARIAGGVGQMLTATASGVAVRIAITKLVAWLEPQLERKG